MKIQKRLAGQLLNSSVKRIRFENSRLADIKEAITKTDIRKLIDEKAIIKINEKGVSRGRTRKNKAQKSKGKRKGAGSREGRGTARLPSKRTWMNKIRSQRELLASLRASQSITDDTFRDLYRKSKGGFFRSKRHIKIYIEDNKLVVKKADKPEQKQAPMQEKKATPKKQAKKKTDASKSE